MTDVTPPTPPSTALPLYLGPALPRWQPRTIAGVHDAIDDGTLAERHWLDAKSMIKSTDGASKETARDLVSFANDGGALLVGVAEDKQTRALSVVGTDLAGLSEQIDQIARYRCDPPLYVICHPLADPADPTRGVMLVEIPPSLSAPHAVDGTYGRGDTTRHHLTDADVARLHAARTTRRVTGEQLIAAEVARDSVAAEHRRNSHLFVVARPLASPPDLLTDLIDSDALPALVRAVEPRVRSAATCAPHWANLTAQERRADGVGFYTYGLSGREFHAELDDAHENASLDLEITDEGRLTLFGGRASDEHRERGGQYLLDAGVTVMTRGVITLAGDLGATAGYAGRWLLAVGISDMRGNHSWQASWTFRLDGSLAAYSADTYTQSTEAVTSELLNQPGAVTRRLVRRLHRALGTSHLHAPLVADGPGSPVPVTYMPVRSGLAAGRPDDVTLARATFTPTAL
jgi:hypothetical protein